MKNKFCREILSLTSITLLFLQIPAQQKALTIGDAIPEAIWKTPLTVVNSTQKTLELGNDRDKLILLDFWATWCASCLKNFPKMEALEKEFAGKVKVLAVTKENQSTLDKFFATKNGQRYRKTASVAGDKLLSQTFPHVAIPFIVWIKNGKVINTTDANQVTAPNIAALLKGDVSELQTVLQIDRSRPLMLAEQFDLEKSTTLMNYALLSKGRILAIAPGTGFHHDKGVTLGRQFTNVPLMNIYKGLAYSLFEREGVQFSEKLFVNLVKNPSPLSVMPNDSYDATGKKLYSYEFLVPVQKSETLYPQMLEYLNGNSGYRGKMELRRRPCLVVERKTVPVPKSVKASGKTIVRSTQPLAGLLADLNELPNSLPPILDESAEEHFIATEAANITSIQMLRNALRENGLDVRETERDLLMFVLEDDPALEPHSKLMQ